MTGAGGAWYTPGMNTTTNPSDPDPSYPDRLPAFVPDREATEASWDAATEADRRAFTDAAAHMSREDWDADNDWLASAGWGEM